MPQPPKSGGHWIYVEPESPKTPPSRSSAGATALLFVGALLLFQSLIGWRGIEAFQRMMHRYSNQIEAAEKQ